MLKYTINTICFLLILIFNVWSFDSHEASLIISFQTDDPNFNLDRVWFSLSNERDERQIFPNNEDYVDHTHLKGSERTVAIRHLIPGHYTLKFWIPNRENTFEIPSARHLLVTENSMTRVNQKIKLREKQGDFLMVPAGEAIVGDPFDDSTNNERPARKIYLSEFAIHIYPVTNAEFAQWLNQAYKKGALLFDSSHPGEILTKDGLLICRTDVANPLSQISYEMNGQIPFFHAQKSKENYPVIEVSWLGAQAYCIDHGYRLPTESEWEKAAGMTLPKDHPSRRYKFGFSHDEIDPLWANYRTSETTPFEKGVFTTPVGFYNGINHVQAGVTNNARSPCGAYDMSGNVWEWVSSLDELDRGSGYRIVKGGCFDSLPDGVRVSERLALPQNHADIYTGFRVAK